MLKWFWQFQNNATETKKQDILNPKLQFVKPGGEGNFIHATQPTVNLHFPMSFPWVLPKFNKSNQQNQPQAHQLYWSLRRVFAIPTDTGVCPSTLCFECHCFWKPKWRWFRPILFKSQWTKIASYFSFKGLVVFQEISPFSPLQPPQFSPRLLDAFFPTRPLHACRRQQNV